MRTLAAILLGLIGCGRIGYDEIAGDAAGPSPDAVDAPEPGVVAACNTPVRLADLPVPPGHAVTALEIGVTATGVIAVWPVEDAVWTSAFKVSPTHHFVELQHGAEVTNYGTSDVAIAAHGDLAVLGVSHHEDNTQHFHPLGATGEWRAGAKIAEDVHSHGNAYLVATPDDLPTENRFGVATTNGTETLTLERDLDSHPKTAPAVTFPGIIADTTGITVLGDGYAVIAGRNERCDIVALDRALVPQGTAQVMDMTCLNAQIAATVGDQVVAAWNCTNDQVWVTGGSMSGPLPTHRAIYGDAEHVASDPRLAVTSAGVWYGFLVSDGRLGRALLDPGGQSVASVPADLVVGAGVVDYDLVSRDDQAYLFWTEVGALTSLWTMRLCTP